MMLLTSIADDALRNLCATAPVICQDYGGYDYAAFQLIT